MDQGRPEIFAFYKVPIVKQVIRLGMHCLYVALMSYVTTETVYSIPPNPPAILGTEHDAILAHIEFHNRGGLEVWWMDAVVWFWTIGLALDEWYKVHQEPDTFSPNIWNRYDYVTLSATFAALTLRVWSLEWSIETMAFSVLLVWCRLFKYLQLSQSIGLLVIMFMEMMKDIFLWVFLSSIFLGAFTVAFVAIADPYALAGSPDHPLTTPVWAMLGAFDKNEVHKWNDTVGEAMLGLYLVISQIVLVNLLIAMMGDTYGNIKGRSDEEWKYGRIVSVLETRVRMSPIPPPLNLPITLYAFINQKLEVLKDCANSASGRKSRYNKMEDEDPAERERMAKERKKMAADKKAKQKVAKKLLRKLKLDEEQEANGSWEEQLKEIRETQANMAESMAVMQRSVVKDRGSKQNVKLEPRGNMSGMSGMSGLFSNRNVSA